MTDVIPVADKENEAPFGLKKTRKGCGCASSSDVNMIDVDGRKVGIRDLEKIFDDLRERKISPDELDMDGLLERFRENNYIAPAKEEEYKEALLLEYKKYFEKEV